ncbi:MAG: hypothetical protein JWR42_2684 [Marmoricola sp.]|nr:hypothetical protein [Marmoricola sp.]
MSDDIDLHAAAEQIRRDQARVWRDAIDVLVQIGAGVIGTAPPEEVLRVAEEQREHLPAGVQELEPLDVLVFVAGQSFGGAGVDASSGDLTLPDLLVLMSLLVREGAGTPFDAAGWLAERTGVGSGTDDAVVEAAVEVLGPLWRELGLLDEELRLTEAGRWVLPHALLGIWGAHVEQLEADAADAPAAADPLPDEVGDAALAMLAQEPMTLEDLADRLEVEPEVLWGGLVVRLDVLELSHGVLVHLPSVVDGMVLTRRLTGAEVDLEVVECRTDLGPLAYLAMDGMPLVGGGEVRSQRRRGPADEGFPAGASEVLRGPEGWLAGLAAGELAAFRVVDGALSVAPTDAVDDPELRERLVVVAERLAHDRRDDDPGVDFFELVVEVLHETPGCFDQPRAPLTELVDDPRLVVHDDGIDLPGAQAEPAPEWLEEDQRSAYVAWRGLLADAFVARDLDEERLAEVAAQLHGTLADAVSSEAAGDVVRSGPVVEALLVRHPGAVTIHLAALVAEARGNGAAFRTLLGHAVEQDPGLVAALADLGDVAAIAGDAREAHRLYVAAGVDPQAPELLALRPMLEPPEGPGRNRPCPCGSGRKYKACHGRTDAHPLPVRGVWLLARFKTFLQRDLNRGVLLDWASTRLGEAEETSDDLEDVVGDPLTWDLAAFDGGVLRRFLELHGAWLADDERELAQGWTSSRRRLLEVLEVRAGVGVRLGDGVSGETLEVPDRTMSQHVRRGDLLLGRLLDEGAGVLRLWDDPVSVDRYVHQPLLALLREDADPRLVARLMTPHRRSLLA